MIFKIKPKFVVFVILIIYGCMASSPRYMVRRSKGEPYGRVANASRKKSAKQLSQNRMMEVIKGYLGTAYLLGGSSRKGMDCSGLVSKVYLESEGLKLPHNANEMYKYGFSVKRPHLKFGDIMFFDLKRKGISHCGIYMGDGSFVHSSISYGVCFESISNTYYKKKYIGAKRISR